MANRVLCIGIGSTGLDICRDIVQRVEMEWGGLERTPWLKVIAYETADISEHLGSGNKERARRNLNRLVNKGIIRRWSLESNEIQSLKRQAAMGQLPPDYDPGVVERMKPLAQGAGNIRMAGRIIARHPSNSRLFYEDVRNALKDLDDCTNLSACNAAAINPDGSPASVNLERNGGRALEVYFVGHAAGGTASGSLIDMAHFARAIARKEGLTANISGFILLPEANHKTKNQVANAYALLRELNHYARKGVRWTGGFPGIQGYEHVEGNPGEMPFDMCSLLSPDAKPTQGAGARGEMIDSVAQFIYHAAMTDLTVDDRFINPDSHRAYKMMAANAPERFCSVATAVIQYPAPLILKGCTSKLGAAAVKQWLENVPDEPLIDSKVKECLGLSGIEAKASNPVASDMERVIGEAKKSRHPSDMINNQWAGIVKQLEPYLVSASAAEAGRKLIERTKSAIITLEEGPVWTRAFIDSISKVLRELDAEADKEKAEEQKAARQQAASISMIRDAEDSILLRIFPFSWWRKIAIEKHARAWFALSAKRGACYLKEKNSRALAGLLPELISADEYRKTPLSRLYSRLLNVKTWLTELNEMLDEDLEESRSSNTSVNGVTLIEVNEIESRYKQYIDSNYQRAAGELSQGRTPEHACRALVTRELGSMLTKRNLFGDERCIFDDLSEDQKGQFGDEFGEDPDKVRESARVVFNDLFRINVLDLLMGKGSGYFDQTIKDVLKVKARPFIDPDGEKLVEGNPWIGSDAAPVHVLIPDGTNLPAAQKVITNSQTGVKEARGVKDGDDRSKPNLMLVVRAQTLFSVASLKNLEEFKKWYDAYATEQGSDGGHAVPGMQVRYDLHYVTPEHYSDIHRNRSISNTGLFLTSLAIGLIDSVSFTYKTRKGLRVGPEKLAKFSKNIQESVEMLNDDQRLQSDLEQVFKEKLADDPGAEDTAQKVGEFQRNCGAWNLSYNQIPPTPEIINAMLRPFGKKHRFWEAYLAYLGVSDTVNSPHMALNREQLNKVLEDEKMEPHPFKTAGFYCPACYQQLQSFSTMENGETIMTGTGSEAVAALQKAKQRLPDDCPFCGCLFSTDSGNGLVH